MSKTRYLIYVQEVRHRAADRDDPEADPVECLLLLGEQDSSSPRSALVSFLKSHPIDGAQEYAVIPARNIHGLTGKLVNVQQLQIETKGGEDGQGRGL